MLEEFWTWQPWRESSREKKRSWRKRTREGSFPCKVLPPSLPRFISGPSPPPPSPLISSLIRHEKLNWGRSGRTSTFKRPLKARSQRRGGGISFPPLLPTWRQTVSHKNFRGFFWWGGGEEGGLDRYSPRKDTHQELTRSPGNEKREGGGEEL